MNPDSRDIEELIGLLVQLREDSLSDPERERLNHILRTDEGLRASAVQFLMDEAALSHELGTDESRALFRESGIAISPKRSDRAGVSMKSNSRRTETRGNRFVWLLAATVLGCVLGFSWGLISGRNASTARVAERRAELEDQVEAPAVSSVICATLTLDEGCQWREPTKLGDHFVAQTYHLIEGLAGLHMTDGSRLFFEGPAGFEIRTSRHVVLKYGNVLADVAEEAVGFRLETPTANVVDVGTAFSVSVEPGGSSELEVLEGAVTLLPSGYKAGANPPLIFSGDIRRIDGQECVVSTRQPDEGLQGRLKALFRAQKSDELIAYDGFDQPIGQVNRKNSGVGWSSPWLLGWEPKRAANIVIREGNNLTAPSWMKQPTSSYVVCPTGSASRRKLQKPLDMTVDATYYVSYLIRTRAVGEVNEQQTGAGLTIANSNDRSSGFGLCIDWRRHLTTWSGDHRWHGDVEMDQDQSAFLVMRITASANGPDEVHAVALNADSLPRVVEPDEWESASPPGEIHGELDIVLLWSGFSAVMLADEIRIGTTWQSVVPVR